MNYNDPENVPPVWQVGDVILDLYEVRPVTEGFGAAARQKNYHEGGFGRVYKIWHQTWHREMAVKTPRLHVFTTQEQKDAFTRECETWVNLGLHSHIAACHYVRELGGLPRVFSEYAPAGTLEEWIRSRRLYEGDKLTALALILDSAIQFAWGLHYAHERGVIHQDVKPLNALIWDDLTLKVSDFGLAGARERAGITDLSGLAVDGLNSLAVSSGGMTPAYCSPEQAAGQKLDRRTDTWSWAVSVLQMFQGEIAWMSGSAAAHALEFLIENGTEEESIPRMPDGVSELLRSCFQKSPADRPRTLHACASALCKLYKSEVGALYPRTEPPIVGETADSLNNRALSMLDLGKPSVAEELLTKAVALDMRHVSATFNRALLRWRKGQYLDTDVLTELNSLRQDVKNSEELHWCIRWVNLERGDFSNTDAPVHGSAEFHTQDGVALFKHSAVSLLPKSSQCNLVCDLHTKSVKCVTFSPDGRLALSSSNDKTLRLWDTATGECVHILDDELVYAAECATFSFDGAHVLSGGWDSSIRLWELQAATCNRIHSGHQGGILSIAASPDGRTFLSASSDKTVRLLDLVTGACLFTLVGHTSSVRLVTYSHDSLFGLSSSQDGTLRLWDLTSGECLKCLEGPTGSTQVIGFSQDGRFAYAGSSDHTLWQWHLGSGQCGLNFEGVPLRHECLALSPEWNFFVTGNEDYTVRVWDAKTGQCLRTFYGHTNRVKSVAVSPDGRMLLSGSADNSVRLWDIAGIVCSRRKSPWIYSRVVTATEASILQNAHDSFLIKAQLAWDSEDVNLALSALMEARAVRGFERDPACLELQAQIATACRVLSFRGGWLVHQLDAHSLWVWSVFLSSNDRLALSGSGDGTAKLWDVASGECCKTFAHNGGFLTDWVRCVALSWDSRFALSGCDDGILRVWDVSTGKSIHELRGHSEFISAVAFSQDGRRAISASGDATVRVWDLITGECSCTLEGHTCWVSAVAFISKSGLAISGSPDRSIRIWNMENGACLRHFDGQCMVLCVAVSSDSRFALSGGDDHSLRMWELASGTCIGSYVGHSGAIQSVVFSDDGHYALSGSSDKTLRLWHLETGKCLRKFEGHTDAITSVALSRDGRYAISGSEDRTVRVWELDWEYEYDPERYLVWKSPAKTE